jgi:hydroxymethylpyrimidine/phosphomethylpyrimidine kinase
MRRRWCETRIATLAHAVPTARPPAVLSIAGSDSGGGAGIQADLRAFARCGVHGMTAITALTAQNTVAVRDVHAVPAQMIVAQVRAVVEDIGVDAVKIGMLGTAETVMAVEAALALLPPDTPVVPDPVMVAESGALLLDDEARIALRDRLLPLATVITPNLPEARVLAGDDPRRERGDDQEATALAERLHALGPRIVVVTGGHRKSVTDVAFDGEAMTLIEGERHPDGAAHGSGCTHSSALAAHLALGFEPIEAARRAKAVAAEAVANGLRGIGAGVGPVDALAIAERGPQRAEPALAARP